VATIDVAEACKGVEIAVMVGGFPRGPGMERKEVMGRGLHSSTFQLNLSRF